MASNPAQGQGGLHGLATRWNDLAKPWRVNVALYALTALSLVALLFEVVAGGDPTPTVDLASQVPLVTTTSPLSSTTRPSTSSSSTSTTSTSTTSTLAPVTVTTRRPVVIQPDPEPAPEPLPDETTTSSTEAPQDTSTTSSSIPDGGTTTTTAPEDPCLHGCQVVPQP